MKNFTSIVVGLLVISSVSMAADCPKEIKDNKRAMSEGPAVLLKYLAKAKHTKISDFSNQIGKAAGGGASGFEAGGQILFLVYAHSDSLGQTANGVLKCDSTSGEFSVVKSNWVSKSSHGID
jgi:hypothetical protein